MNEVIKRYEALKEKVSERWAEFAELMKFVETETEYLTAPASTKFHLCKKSGLLEPTLKVYNSDDGILSRFFENSKRFLQKKRLKIEISCGKPAFFLPDDASE